MKKLFSTFIIWFIFFATPVDMVFAKNSLKVEHPKKVDMGTISIADYETGYKEKIEATVLTVKDDSNDWKVMVSTKDDNMGAVGDYIKPIADLNWRSSGATATQLTYTSLTNYDVEVARSFASSATIMVYIDYKILLSWALDAPGTYNIDVLYTLTTQ